jgi:predicted ATPase
MHISDIVLRHDLFPTSDHYPFCLPVLRKTQHVHLTTPVTFFVGENGSGKSTLLRAVCKRCGIHIWQGMERSRYSVNMYEDKLYRATEIHWTDGPVHGSFFGSDVFREYARVLDDWAASDPGQLDTVGGQSLLTQSHGQSLMAYFRARYELRGIHLLDEPETALSPSTQIELLNLIAGMSRAGHAQFIIATHSPILLACPGARIYSFDRVPIAPIAYRDTDHYRVYRDFLDDPSAFMEEPR